MKQLLIGSLVMFFAATASAHGCPGEMRTIDAKMPTAKLPAAEMSKVKALREEGEKLHKEGKHTESMSSTCPMASSRVRNPSEASSSRTSSAMNSKKFKSDIRAILLSNKKS